MQHLLHHYTFPAVRVKIFFSPAGSLLRWGIGVWQGRPLKFGRMTVAGILLAWGTEWGTFQHH
jgi:hypothetical protein